MFTAILSQDPIPMILYQPAIRHSDPIKRPTCSKCDQRRSYLELKLQAALATSYLLSCALSASTLKQRSGKSRKPPQLTA